MISACTVLICNNCVPLQIFKPPEKKDIYTLNILFDYLSSFFVEVNNFLMR